MSLKVINAEIKQAAFQHVCCWWWWYLNVTCLLKTNGTSGVEVVNDSKIDSNFQEALNYLFIDLAKNMIRDGKDVTKFIEANVCGSKDLNNARLAAKSINSSSLFKSAIFGWDPNWGRIMSSIGYSGYDLNLDIIAMQLLMMLMKYTLLKKVKFFFLKTSHILKGLKKSYSQNM